LQRRRLSPEASSKSGGAFTFRDAPWQEEVLDAPDDPEVGEVVLMWASQVTGKTETINNMIGSDFDLAPCPILMLQPTLEMAETWSKDRLAPMLRDTPALRGKVKDARSRDANNTILHKSFPGGHITIAGANSAASLASRPIRKIYFDEIDRYPASAGTEGDPIAIAEKRTESFPDAVKVLTSTPTIKKISKIEKRFEASDKRYWFCPCPHCQAEQTLKWPHVKWLGDDPLAASIWYECEKCLKPWTDEERQAAIRAGKWKATAPFRGIRGYHLNGIYCLFRSQKPYKNRLQQMVAGYQKAKEGGKYTEMVWVNTFLAETYEDATESIESSDLLTRREDYGPELPNKVLFLTAGVDVQKNRIEVEIDAWGDKEESWGVEYIVIPCDVVKEDWHSELDNILINRRWKTKDGRELKLDASAIDSGAGAWTNFVYRYCKPRFSKRIYAIKGSNQAGQPVVIGMTHGNRMRCPVYRLGTDTAKDIIYGRLRLNPLPIEGAENEAVKFPPGYMHYTRRTEARFDAEYFKMLTAEEVRVKIVKGFPVRYYALRSEGIRNEALDLRVYSYSALCILQPDWILLTKRLAQKQKVYTVRSEKSDENAEQESQQTPEQPKPTAKPVRKSFVPRSGKSFVNGWKKF
jgi:phage terminase large subunit GpA-like protein